MATPQVADPLALAKRLWPDVTFYREQREIIYSVVNNDETYVRAGNMLGKDFVAAFIALWFFLTRHPCRIITTSADYSQLEAVLWGEIRRFIQMSKYQLDNEKGGPLVINHLHIRKVVDGQMCGLSYMMGRVAAKGEGMLGHHIADIGDGIPRTLFIADEASGVDDISYDRADTWAKRKLAIGNPYPCNNFFRRASRDGDLPATTYFLQETVGDNGEKKQIVTPMKDSNRLYRRVIRIRGDDSPNVRLAFTQQKVGIIPTGEVILPGVLPWSDYVTRRTKWDKVRQCISLDAEFYEGAEVLLFPPEWLNRAEQLAQHLEGTQRRAKTIGIDTGEGVANTAMAAIDEYGLIELVSKQTPDTDVIIGDVKAFGMKHGVKPDNWIFDRGGGGKQHADRLRADGFKVRTVAFGEAIALDPRSGRNPTSARLEAKEDRYAYKNRRAQMYGNLREQLDPEHPGAGFAIPARYTMLRHQLSPIPLIYDSEGRLELPPKTKRDSSDKRKTLIEIIGASPDEADAVVLALHGMLHKPIKVRVGAR